MSLEQELAELNRCKNPHERGRNFEAFLAHLLKEEGFEVTRNANATPPFQTDLFARRDQMYFLVEAKWLRRRLSVGNVSQVRDRLNYTPRDVFACVFSMSGYGDGALREFCADRSREIILFDGRETHGIATGTVSLEELLDTKREVLRRYSDMWFWQGETMSAISFHLRSGHEVFQFGEETKNWLLSVTDGNDVLFCNESLDFTNRQMGPVVSLYLRIDLRSVTDLRRLLRIAEREFGLANVGAHVKA